MFMLKVVTEVMVVFHTPERTMGVKYRTVVQVDLAVMYTSVQVLDCRTCTNLEGLILREIPGSLVRAKRIMVLMRKTYVSQFLWVQKFMR